MRQVCGKAVGLIYAPDTSAMQNGYGKVKGR
jgi:hypothetical protein